MPSTNEEAPIYGGYSSGRALANPNHQNAFRRNEASANESTLVEIHMRDAAAQACRADPIWFQAERKSTMNTVRHEVPSAKPYLWDDRKPANR